MSISFEEPRDHEREKVIRRSRRNSRKQLQNIRDIVARPKTPNLEHSVCEKSGILHDKPLSFNASSKDRPIFFDPYKGELDDLTEPDDVPHKHEPGDEKGSIRDLC